MDNLLEVTNVTKSYNHFKALDDVSLNVPQGSIFGLLGPNGAGKTTLIRIINQIIAPDEGTVFFKGEPMREETVRKIGYLPEERGLYPKMKVGEQLIYLARLKGFSRSKAYQKVGEWLGEFDILDWWDKQVETLSKGMAQKLQFIATVVHEPDFLILDEPFSGFDPINAELVKQKILALKEQGATIMLSTHRMENVEALCEYLAMINESRKVLDGDIESIKQQHRTHTYEIAFKGHCQAHQLRLPQVFEIKDIKYRKAHDHTLVTIHTNGQAQNNQVIADLMKHHEIESFRELLPTMHDIFIETVKEKSHA